MPTDQQQQNWEEEEEEEERKKNKTKAEQRDTVRKRETKLNNYRELIRAAAQADTWARCWPSLGCTGQCAFCLYHTFHSLIPFIPSQSLCYTPNNLRQRFSLHRLGRIHTKKVWSHSVKLDAAYSYVSWTGDNTHSFSISLKLILPLPHILEGNVLLFSLIHLFNCMPHYSKMAQIQI